MVRSRRGPAALVALLAWAGLGVQFAAVVGRVGSVAGAAWSMLAFFTVTSNLLLAVLLTGVALGRRAFAAPRLAAGVALAMLLVGVVYYLLLRGMLELSGGDLVADWLLHTATPLLAPLYWLACVPKGALSRRDPVRWALYPLGYLAYALSRGAMTGRYPYPFLDVTRLGRAGVAGSAAAIALGFLGAGYVLVWLDGRLAREPSR